ncbi:MAG TPA: hypothetical protein VKB69_17340 [Micromonosporaceae bacterium]|nr:hypothetical protein [Micromonosporaceae bacterium]
MSDPTSTSDLSHTGDLPSRTAIRPAHAADPDPDVAYYSGAYPPPVDTVTEQVDLSADPFADDLEAELAAAAPKKWYNRATYALGALALLVGGFLAGVQVDKHYGANASAANARNAALAALGNGGFNGRGFGGRGGEGGAGGSGATPSASAGTPSSQSLTGKITLVDGSTVYVTLDSGDVLTVRTNAKTKVNVGTATKVSQLKAGQTVTVTGSPDSSGNVTAVSITS